MIESPRLLPPILSAFHGIRSFVHRTYPSFYSLHRHTRTTHFRIRLCFAFILTTIDTALLHALPRVLPYVYLQIPAYLSAISILVLLFLTWCPTHDLETSPYEARVERTSELTRITKASVRRRVDVR
jgi:hypothetical protein